MKLAFNVGLISALWSYSWEQERSRRVRKWREELRRESYGKDDSEKDSDTGDDQSDIMEPPEVTTARENIHALVGDQGKLHRQKVWRWHDHGSCKHNLQNQILSAD